MRRLVAFCLGRPITTRTSHSCRLLPGASAGTRVPLTALPRSERPRVRVSVPYPNAEPRQVELEVTRPLEEALATLRGIKEIWSESRFGQGQVNLQFEWGTDLDQVKLEVRERLARVRNELPVDDIERIRIRSGGWRSGDAIIQGRISSKGVDLSQNYELLLNRLRRPLERIEGVAQVEMDGVTPLEIQVTFRQDDLDRHGLRLDQIIRRLEDNNIDITVGELLEEGKLRRLRVVNTFHGLEDVRAFPVNAQGVPLEQVAKVELTEGELRWGRHLNGRYAVSLEVFKESDANTVETCARIRGAI
ncbi:MAG: efflux RND transporter permease subunit, partial [Planctomycetota bacterium]